MENSNKIKVIVLAGGLGKRMQSELPKVLIPLHGKPLVAHVLESIRKSGICERPVVVVGQKREVVMNALGENYDYVIQEEQLGTGHAVLTAMPLLENKFENIIVLYGDHPFVSPETLKKLVDKHLNSSSYITLATVKLQDFEEWRSVFYTNFSRIVRDREGNIIKDVQFRDATEEEKEIKEVNPCYFCFKADWLWESLKKLKTDNDQREYYLTDLVKMAMQEKLKVESINIDALEALGVNSKTELETLETLHLKFNL